MRYGFLAFALVLGIAISAATQHSKAASPRPAAQTPPGTPGEGEGGPLLNKIFERTRTARYSADYTAIIDQCQEALRIGVKDNDAIKYAEKLMAWAHNRRGELLAAAGRPTEALSDFSSALALDETHWRAFHNRGVSHAKEGSLEDALNDFNKALELNKTFVSTWYNRAEVKYQKGDFEAAVKDYNEALKLSPRDGAILNARGHAQYRIGHLREAQQDFAAAVELAPNNASAWVNLGDFYLNQGDYAQATRDYRQAINVNPQFGRAYQSAAWLLATCPDVKYRDANLAIECAKKAIELDGRKDFRYLDTLAAALANAGKFPDAVEVQKDAVKGITDNDSAPYEERLKMYMDKLPFREEVKKIASEGVERR